MSYGQSVNLDHDGKPQQKQPHTHRQKPRHYREAVSREDHKNPSLSNTLDTCVGDHEAPRAVTIFAPFKASAIVHNVLPEARIGTTIPRNRSAQSSYVREASVFRFAVASRKIRRAHV